MIFQRSSKVESNGSSEQKRVLGRAGVQKDSLRMSGRAIACNRL